MARAAERKITGYDSLSPLNTGGASKHFPDCTRHRSQGIPGSWKPTRDFPDDLIGSEN